MVRRAGPAAAVLVACLVPTLHAEATDERPHTYVDVETTGPAGREAPALTGGWTIERGLPRLDLAGVLRSGQHTRVIARIGLTEIERTIPRGASWCLVGTSDKGNVSPDFQADETLTFYVRQPGGHRIPLGYPFPQGPSVSPNTYAGSVGFGLERPPRGQRHWAVLRSAVEGTASHLTYDLRILRHPC